MIGFIAHLDAPCHPEVAFDRLADMAELDRWNPNVTTSRSIEGGRLQPGSRYESTIVRGPLRMKASTTLVAVEPGRYVRYEGTIGIVWSADELHFESTDSGCRITFVNETRAPWWLRPLGPLLNAAFQPQARKAVVGAERYLAGGE